MKRAPKDFCIICLKGLAMGAADVVPGVSGGTIAFISGIYEELIDTINKINLNTFKILRKQGFIAAWKSINGSFLISLLLGICISFLSLAQLIKWLLENKPILVWSFFFGLVLASIYFVAKQLDKWNFIHIVALIIGAIIAYIITVIPALHSNNTPWFMFIAGALAICAMILPGISGSFILVLLGAYKPVLNALLNKDFKILFFLIFGAIVGLLSFSRLLKWMFAHHKNTTLAVLTGFLVGSLNKIWPWKKVLQSEIINGKLKIISEIGVSPFHYQGDNQLLLSILLALSGLGLILLLEKVAQTKSE